MDWSYRLTSVLHAYQLSSRSKEPVGHYCFGPYIEYSRSNIRKRKGHEGDSKIHQKHQAPSHSISWRILVKIGANLFFISMVSWARPEHSPLELCGTTTPPSIDGIHE